METLYPGEEAGVVAAVVDIHAPIDRVWDWVADTVRWPDWRVPVKRIEMTAGGALGQGTEGVIFGTGEVHSARFRVVECRAPDVLSYETGSLGQHLLVTCALEQAGGGCRLTSRIEASGLLGALLGVLGAADIRRDLRADADRLKLMCKQYRR